ncbi:lachesin-like [Zootermopsis nevadensis]|uniref:lachesin-like n=1 Tax=Zootermopsis nevadensis TaxID=136037 RepID=UPI000B8E945C|nr:lachesin-like [Zootermopsis nevadensis]XP_021923335.1 lachesin-like [Zootermopsis nevadensis]XP_021923336.1 lachesin-like [Zootermopsis nevadensis]XP_021923337.1 lachesin-like [Zootermopsis nevadensis]
MFCLLAFVGALFALALPSNNVGVAYQPEFTEPIANLTVPLGRDATFRCMVQHLGGYRIGWVKADTKAIQAINDHVVIHNPRVSVSHVDHTMWNLHVKNVHEEDRGMYMCQINTDPMKSQLGYMDVVVPPDFINEDTSGDVMVPEGGTVKLTCRARGYPEPHVLWRREDNADIVIKEPSGVKTRVSSYQGEILKLTKIMRSEMGSYLCIASNGVPPSVSKRIMVSVHFYPVIQVPNQLVGAPLGTQVTIECFVEASPKSINYWVRDTEMVISSDKYEVKLITRSFFEMHMILVIKKFQARDVGSYRCIAKNSLGEVESNIRLYGIPGPTRRVFTPRYEEDEDYMDQYGSAEQDEEEEQTNILVQRPGHRVVVPTLGLPVLGTHRTYPENRVLISPARGGGSSPSLSRGSRSQHIEVWVVGVTTFLLFLRLADEV